MTDGEHGEADMSEIAVTAWVPVTALAKAVLIIEEDEWAQLSRNEKVDRIRTEGDTDAHICDACSENLQIDEGILDAEDSFTDDDIKFTFED